MTTKSKQQDVARKAAKKKVVASLRKAGNPRKISASALKRRQKAVEDKRETILAAAQSVFSRYGLHGASIDQIAARADVSKSNLLYYFTNKDDLYLSVLQNLLTAWLEPLQNFAVETDPEKALKEYIQHKLALSRDNPEASRLFCLEVVQGAPLVKHQLANELRELVDRKSKVIRTWIEEKRLNPIEPSHFIFSIWAITQHYADFAVQVEAVTGKTLNDPAFFDETVENVQRIIMGGLIPSKH